MVKIKIIEGGFGNIMKIFIGFLIIFLLFIPIPLKIYILYKNNKLIIRFYKFSLYPSKDLKNMPTTVAKVKEKSKLTVDFKKAFDKHTIKQIFHRFCKSKLKPSLKLDFNLDYGFEDAALTGLSYGLLNSFFVPLQNILSSLFKIKKLQLNAMPDFNGSNLNLEIKSIIYINIVQIINICFTIGLILFKSYRNNKYIHKTKGEFKEA